jgi:hypothetical protein
VAYEIFGAMELTNDLFYFLLVSGFHVHAPLPLMGRNLRIVILRMKIVNGIFWIFPGGKAFLGKKFKREILTQEENVKFSLT